MPWPPGRAAARGSGRGAGLLAPATVAAAHKEGGGELMESYNHANDARAWMFQPGLGDEYYDGPWLLPSYMPTRMITDLSPKLEQSAFCRCVPHDTARCARGIRAASAMHALPRR
jgi:hypothetical protein